MQTKHGFNLFIVIILLMIGVAGCVQPASEEIAPTEIGARTTFTPTFTPSDTPPPTETATPFEAEAQAEEAETETPTPTETETPTPTETSTSTPTPTATEAESASVSAQDDAPTLDPAFITPTLPEGISESQLTATAIIAGATQTQAFVLTSTAAANGIGLPTASPTPTADTGATAGGDLGVATTVATAVPGADCYHEVKTQDRSLYRLSLAYGVPINSIATASGIVNPDLIRVGQLLTIPGCGTTGAVPPATSTPNPNAVAFGTGGTGTNTDTSALAVNPTGDCTWGTSVTFPNGCPTTTGATTTTDATTGTTGTTTGTGGPAVTTGSRTHTVAQGETLYEISLAYGVTMDVIASANGLTNYDSILFNQVLVIP